MLGEGRAEVKVTAELNFDQVRMTSKSYEPSVGTEGILRAHQNKTETYTGVGGIPGGVPGVESNIPGYQAVVGGNLSFSKHDETRNFEVNEKVEEVIRACGGVAEYRAAVSVTHHLTELRLEVEPADGCTDPSGLVSRLQKGLHNAFALRVPVEVVPPGTLPRFEMKAQRWRKV